MGGNGRSVGRRGEWEERGTDGEDRVREGR